MLIFNLSGTKIDTEATKNQRSKLMANGYCQNIYGYEEVNNRIAKMKEEEEEEEAKNSEPTTKQNNSWYCQTIPGQEEYVKHQPFGNLEDPREKKKK